jgi:uncharacterized protein (DUF433 family)
LEEHTVVDPDVMAGKPVVRGTRIPVDAVIGRLAAEMSRGRAWGYPVLPVEDVKAALAYGVRVASGE